MRRRRFLVVAGSTLTLLALTLRLSDHLKAVGPGG